ncbi:MAG: AAA family ATPase, partial [Gammaproteobacteria bacterium]|nr:AAA family ATPase [Gammaproteobacteria bacterium]
MQRRRLPTGISSFDEIRNWNFYYADKTPHILNLVEYPGRYFLSRPRRFGKSLLVDTMAELFHCNQKLFQGLYIHDRWDWDNSHPVLFSVLAVVVSVSRGAWNWKSVTSWLRWKVKPESTRQKSTFRARAA